MSEPVANIIRFHRSNQGTEGILLCGQFSWFTMEPPWKNNTPNRSCIPPGEYNAEICQSPKYGRIFHIKGVPDRTHILIHSGNWAGDRDSGLKSHSYGCILLGMKRGWLQQQRAVLGSRIALRQFMVHSQNQFRLIIKEVCHA